jgi:hypothetical protein
VHNSASIDHAFAPSLDETTVTDFLVGFGEYAPASHVARVYIAASAGDRFAPVLRRSVAFDARAPKTGVASVAGPNMKAKAPSKVAKTLKRT